MSRNSMSGVGGRHGVGVHPKARVVTGMENEVV